MERATDQCLALDQYVHRLGVCGDRHTRYTLSQTVQGILGGQSARCAQIARSAPGLAVKDRSEQRVRDMLVGRTTKNSPGLDEQHIVQRLVQRGVERLSADDEIWVALDTGDLCKPYATKMPDLMQVRDLNGRLVPGYRVITALGLGKTARMSAKVTFVIDRGLDNIAHWHRIWQHGHHVVGRLRDLGLYDSMATIAMLEQYKAEHGDLPPRIAAIVQGALPLQL